MQQRSRRGLSTRLLAVPEEEAPAGRPSQFTRAVRRDLHNASTAESIRTGLRTSLPQGLQCNSDRVGQTQRASCIIWYYIDVHLLLHKHSSHSAPQLSSEADHLSCLSLLHLV